MDSHRDMAFHEYRIYNACSRNKTRRRVITIIIVAPSTVAIYAFEFLMPMTIHAHIALVILHFRKFPVMRAGYIRTRDTESFNRCHNNARAHPEKSPAQRVCRNTHPHNIVPAHTRVSMMTMMGWEKEQKPAGPWVVKFIHLFLFFNVFLSFAYRAFAIPMQHCYYYHPRWGCYDYFRRWRRERERESFEIPEPQTGGGCGCCKLRELQLLLLPLPDFLSLSPAFSHAEIPNFSRSDILEVLTFFSSSFHPATKREADGIMFIYLFFCGTGAFFFRSQVIGRLRLIREERFPGKLDARTRYG